MPSPELIQKIKSQFPVLSRKIDDKEICWLDSTATTQKPLSVIDAVDDFYRHHYSSVKRGVYKMSEQTTQAFESARQKVANLIHAPTTDSIIFTRGTTESINLVASSWGRKFLSEGDEIILSQLEHHANIVPWQMIAAEKKAIIKVIPCNDAGELILEEYIKLLNPRTKMVACTHIANSIGTINPIQKIIELAHQNGSLTLVDAAQSIAHEVMDVQKLDADFLVFSGHKMYGPTGIGVLYGKYDLLCQMPPYHGGGEMIESVSFSGSTYALPPARFEAGTPDIAGVIGLGKAIDFIQEIGFDILHKHEQNLLQYATQKLSEIPGLTIIGTAQQKCAIVSFTLKSAHPHDAAMILDEEAIALRAGHHCAQPVMERFKVVATLRASFAIYNTTEDVDRLVLAILRINRLFA